MILVLRVVSVKKLGCLKGMCGDFKHFSFTFFLEPGRMKSEKGMGKRKEEEEEEEEERGKKKRAKVSWKGWGYSERRKKRLQRRKKGTTRRKIMVLFFIFFFFFFFLKEKKKIVKHPNREKEKEKRPIFFFFFSFLFFLFFWTFYFLATHQTSKPLSSPAIYSYFCLFHCFPQISIFFFGEESTSDDFQNVSSDSSCSNISSCTCPLDHKGVGVSLGGKGDNVVTSLQVGKRMAFGISTRQREGELEEKMCRGRVGSTSSVPQMKFPWDLSLQHNEEPPPWQLLLGSSWQSGRRIEVVFQEIHLGLERL